MYVRFRPRLAMTLALLAGTSVAYAGPLDPPAGAVAPTMKTIEQVEPRIAVGPVTTPGDAACIYKITQPGSYYLTSNIQGAPGKEGILIAADDVTLDLNGFALEGSTGLPVPSANGIKCNTVKNVSISNGAVSNWGQAGVYAQWVSGGVFDRLRVAGNAGRGLMAGSGSTVTLSTAVENDGFGLSGMSHNTFSDCVAKHNGGNGIDTQSGTITNCTAADNGGIGISMSYDGTVTACASKGNASIGIFTQNEVVVRGCTVAGNTGDGIYALAYCVIADNNCSYNGLSTGNGAGIRLAGSACRVENNHVINNDQGIKATGTVNLIVRNAARSNTVNYDIISGNRVGAIVVAPLSAAISGNSGGGLGTTDPWANFAY